MTSGSLKLRLAAGGALALAVALLIAGIGLVQLFERNALRALEADLEADLRQALSVLELDVSARPTLTRALTDPRFDEPMSGLYWQLGTPDGIAARSRSLWDETLKLPGDSLSPGELHRHQVTLPDGRPVMAVERVVIMTANGKDLPVRIAVAADTSRIAAAKKAFTGELIPSLVLLGLVLALATWVQIGLGLRPLGKLQDAVAAIRQGRARHVAGPVPSEVAPLVEEINGLLDAQAREIERSRARAQDLAHGLRTPLAALDADVRALESGGQKEIAARIADVSETMRRHVEREMARANIRGKRAAAVATEIVPLVRSLITIQERTAHGERLTFSVDCPADATIAMDKGDLAEVLGNLLENAARHARTKVCVVITNDRQLAIDDDGPGIAPEKLARVRERGERLDSKGDGAGLGLAIVTDILEANGRELMLGLSPLGGLRAGFPM